MCDWHFANRNLFINHCLQLSTTLFRKDAADMICIYIYILHIHEHGHCPLKKQTLFLKDISTLSLKLLQVMPL